ncbi:hypothetical protein Hanom_Chr05g00416701 [Helianthus anomalus]
MFKCNTSFYNPFLVWLVFVYKMAPKEQKRKPATKKAYKSEEQKMSKPRHNMVAYLDPQENLV